MLWFGWGPEDSFDLREILEFSELGYLLGTTDLEVEGPCFDKK